jgi:hypothetical protein
MVIITLFSVFPPPLIYFFPQTKRCWGKEICSREKKNKRYQKIKTTTNNQN